MRNKNTQGVKKGKANQKLSFKRPKHLISRKAKKLKLFLYIYNDIFLAGHFTTMIDFVTWPPLQIKKGGQVIKSIIIVKMPCEKNIILYIKEKF